MSLTALVNLDKTAAQNKINSNNSQISGIEELITNLDNQIESLENQVTSLQTENTTLTAQLAEYDQIITILNGQ